MLTKHLSFLFFFLIGLLFFSCKKENTLPPSNNEFPIELKVEKIGTEYEFSWTKTNVSTFLGYEIEMSDQSIPVNYLDTVHSINSSSFIIGTQNQNQLITPLIPSADTMYYRLFVWIGPEKYRVSNEVKVGFENVSIINQRIYDSFFDNNTNTFSFIQNTLTGADSIITLDYKNQIYYENEFWSFNLEAGDVGENNLNAELYMPNINISDITIFDFPNLNPIDNISLNQYLRIKKIASNDNDLLALLLYESINTTPNVNLQIINRVTKEIIYEDAINSQEHSTRISFFPNDPNKLLVLHEHGKTIYEFNQSGLVNRIDTEETFSSIEPVFSPDGNYFILSTSNSNESILYLINTSLELIESYEIQYKDFIFSEDGTKIYAIDGWSDKNLAIYNFPEMKLERNIPLHLKGKRLFINDNHLMIYGNPLRFDIEKHIFAVIEI